MTDPVQNRPSASEEAAAMARRSDATRDKKTESKAAAQASQGQKVAGQEKQLKSSFDDVLSKLSEGNAPTVSQEAAKFDSKLQEAHRDQDHSSSRDHDDDKKPTDKADAGKKTKEGSETARERVVGKSHSGQGGQQDSGKGGGEEKGGGGRGFGQKNQAALAKEQAQMQDFQKMQAAPAPAPMPMQAVATAAPAETVAAPRELPKPLLEQIINYVRIGLDKKLNKVMEIEFKDQVFNGLQLKVTSHGKEVSIEFIVPNRSVRECFLQERENLAMTLGEKGIDCRDIVVSMR
jgi:hypothetical protein